MSPKAKAKPDPRLGIVQLRLDRDMLASFRQLANENGQSVPGRLRVLIRQDVERSANPDAAIAS